MLAAADYYTEQYDSETWAVAFSKGLSWQVLNTARIVIPLHIICYTARLSEAVKQISIDEILQVFNEW